MANIGLRYPRYCRVNITQAVDGSETETLGVGAIMGKAISANLNVSAEPQVQYADDGPAETVTEFGGGTLAAEQNDLIDTVAADILGQTIDDDGDLVAKQDDNAPYLRVAWIVSKIRNNKRWYTGICLMRIKFAPASPQYTTKGQNITFGSTTLNGQIMRNADGIWKREHTFDTFAAALTWINTMTNIPAGSAPALTVAFDPADSATGVFQNAIIKIALSNPVEHGSAVLLDAAGTPAQITRTFSGDKKILTLTPAVQLATNTQYRIITSGIVDVYAQILPDTESTFTTEA